MTRPPLVTIIDDDESVRESLPDLVKLLGYPVRAFSTAGAFLDLKYVDETRCLILDIAMPGMTGPELKVELQRRGHKIPSRLHHRSWRRDSSSAPAETRCRRSPVQAIQRPSPAESLRSVLPPG